MKKYLITACSIAAFGLASLFGPSSIANEQNKHLTYKIEKVEKYLEEQPLGLGTILVGDFENVDEVRSCMILNLESFDEEAGILTGIGPKGDALYLINAKSDIELTDYKNNGYGSVDEILIRNKHTDAKTETGKYRKITNLTKEQAEIANKMYELIINEYDKQIIIKDVDNESLKTSGEKLERLIEELKLLCPERILHRGFPK